jgi:linalool 8-monooxygenase
MSLPDYLSAFILLVVAGNATTRNSISGFALVLAQHAAERRKWVDHPSLIPRAVNEIIRSVHSGIYTGRTAYTRRTALADHAIRGVAIRKGDELARW